MIEAKDIDLERGTKLERDWNELTVLDTLDEICSPDFRLHIRMEGKLESLPRKANLKRTFEKLLREARYEEVLLVSQGQQGLNLVLSHVRNQRDRGDGVWFGRPGC